MMKSVKHNSSPFGINVVGEELETIPKHEVVDDEITCWN